MSTEQSFEQENSREDRAGNEQPGEDMELDFGSWLINIKLAWRLFESFF